MELSKLPGFTEALASAEAEERKLRGLAFLDVNVEICGIEVRQYCPRHYQLLEAAESPFVRGGRNNLAHALQFLWIVSPQYAPDREKAATFVREVASRLPKLPELRHGIQRYIRLAWMDKRAGARKKGASSPFASTEAELVHEFAKAYGWPREYTMQQPFALLFQQQRLIDRDSAAECGHRLNFENAISSVVETLFARQWVEEQASRRAEAPTP